MNAGATFTTSPDNTYISSVSLFIGEGRQRKVRKFNLTILQGKFLYYLPFPSAAAKSVQEIMKEAKIDETRAAEIIDIVDVLIERKVIEVEKASNK